MADKIGMCLAVVGLSVVACLLVWKGEFASALAAAAMIAPGALQMKKASEP